MYACDSTVEPEPGLDGLKCTLRKLVDDIKLREWSLLSGGQHCHSEGPWQARGMGEERLRELHWLSLEKRGDLTVVFNFLK